MRFPLITIPMLLSVTTAARAGIVCHDDFQVVNGRERSPRPTARTILSRAWPAAMAEKFQRPPFACASSGGQDHEGGR